MVDKTNLLLSSFESVSKMRIGLYTEDVKAKKIHPIDIQYPIDMYGTFEISNSKKPQYSVGI